MNSSFAVVSTARLLACVFCLLSFFLPGIAVAQSDSIADKYEKEFENADAKLNTVYKKVLSKITVPASRPDFIKAQRAWIAFRDAEAPSIATVTRKHGIVWEVTEIGERTRLTVERTKQLEALLKDLGMYEND